MLFVIPVGQIKYETQLFWIKKINHDYSARIIIIFHFIVKYYLHDVLGDSSYVAVFISSENVTHISLGGLIV